MKKYFFLFTIIIIQIYSVNNAMSQNVLTHRMGLNVGYSIIFDKYSNINLGLNYQMKKSEGKLGIGFFGNYILGAEDDLLLGFPVFAHDVFGVKNLVLSAAPGVAVTNSLDYLKYIVNPEENDVFLKETPTRLNFLFRLSAEWEFKLPDNNAYNFTINPYLSTDFVAFYRTYLTIGVKVNYALFHKNSSEYDY